ncbi:coiled-coil domain-containing protein 117 isoform X1 [Nelusetta ayraudi]|uniref:coiled-coil domain-containing protein 117 isoform X1 n=1 Tax=Nelusetta ayraudi TaxID=303726 RepID=UPI003F710B28
MHHSAPASSEVGFLPTMYSFSGPTSLPEFDLGSPSASHHLQRTAQVANSSWEARCLRKNRRRVDDEACSAKRRRLMVETEVDISETSTVVTHVDWPPPISCPPLPAPQAGPAPPQCHRAPQDQTTTAVPRPETDGSCMEIEAAQRKLQEIEDRITLEDDDEDEGLDVESAPRRPVLVISDSLKEGLQRGISDILPHTVAQSVSHSCMELVLWRPPEDPFCRKQRDSIHRHLKQQTASSLSMTPCPSPAPRSPPSPPADTRSSLFSLPAERSCGEEEMEME